MTIYAQFPIITVNDEEIAKNDTTKGGPTMFTATESRIIKAPADRIYNLLADYKNGHPTILPKPTFADLTVEQGGIGAGTVIRVTTVAMGQSRTLRLTVTEPEPGRVLQEEDPDAGVTTHFIVTPVSAGSQLTITSKWEPKPGLMNRLETWITSLFAGPLYRKELALVAAKVEG
jgi:hypothetical protein